MCACVQKSPNFAAVSENTLEKCYAHLYSNSANKTPIFFSSNMVQKSWHRCDCSIIIFAFLLFLFLCFFIPPPLKLIINCHWINVLSDRKKTYSCFLRTRWHLFRFGWHSFTTHLHPLKTRSVSFISLRQDSLKFILGYFNAFMSHLYCLQTRQTH